MQLKIISAISILFFSVFLAAESAPLKTVRAGIEEATVFFVGAELVHTAKAQLAKGASELRIDGLSPRLDRNSIKVKTTNGVSVSAFEFNVDHLSGASLSPEVRKLETELNEQKKILEEMTSVVNINTNALQFLKTGVSKKTEGSPNTSITIDELGKTIDYYSTKAAELERTLRANKERRDKQNEKVQNLTRQFEQEKVKHSRTSGSLKLNLSSPVNNECHFTVSYYTRDASWSPYYNINVASTDKPIQIDAKAKVRQTSGIDWTNVKITLSTATASRGKAAPLFNAWFLRLIEPARRLRSADMMSETLSQNTYSYRAESVLREDDGLADSEPIRQNENQLSIVYDISAPYSIPGNGKEQSIDLKAQSIPASFKYYCAPKLDYETYVLAEIADWEKLSLLDGIANVTYDGTYIGETYIRASTTEEKMTLTLGTDKRVVVKREKLRDYSSTGFLGNSVKQDFVFQLTVRNNQSRPIRMVLKDQYPLSTSKDIVVDLSNNTTKPTTNREDIGVITWEFDMKPGETRVFQLAYSVRYPKGSIINW
ncbi:MAG: mucoidy inhibitor MuiA family protein [Leptospirales bacterium]|nr:mucoidy inhibitor MuiA family protein [Leptospirales bacterium]